MPNLKHALTVVLSSIFLGTLTQAHAYAVDDESTTPGAIAEKAGAKMLDEVRRHGTDKQRWRTFTFYNDDSDPASLRMVLVKSANFVMRLDPKHDLLYFEKPGMQQVFHVSGKSEANRVCPSYDISVIDASPTHATILQRCIVNDAPPGQMHFRRDYYLYDMKTAMMVNIWDTGDEVKKVPLSFVPPDPVVTMINNGYRVDWHYNDRTTSPPDVVDLHIEYRYVKDNATKKYSFSCKDLTNTQHLEGDMCSIPVDLDLKAISNRNIDDVQ